MKLVGLVGAVAALMPAAAVAAPTSAPDELTASSYADLLRPIPNAVQKLKASDAVLRQENDAKVEMAQFYHHHHHHHFFHRRFYHHHHHHFFRGGFRHHHHHHHHFHP